MWKLEFQVFFSAGYKISRNDTTLLLKNSNQTK
jgi:hypothetical protein